MTYIWQIIIDYRKKNEKKIFNCKHHGPYINSFNFFADWQLNNFDPIEYFTYKNS